MGPDFGVRFRTRFGMPFGVLFGRFSEFLLSLSGALVALLGDFWRTLAALGIVYETFVWL